MDFTILDTYSYTDLKNMSSRMELPSQKTKQDYIKSITEAFREYEEYKKNKIDKYTKIRQLGSAGKEGTTYLVKTKKGKEYAMKTFKKHKSSDTLVKEMELQKIASKHGISPKIIDYDTVSKYIVMEKMDENLFDVMIKNKGKLSTNHQQQLIQIFQKLDNAFILHNDPNPLNFMLKEDKIYIIDFGFAKKIDSALIKKFKTDTPNMKFMVLGFLLKMRDLQCDAKYKVLEKHLSTEDKETFGFL